MNILNFFEKYKNLPHVSKYHAEGFYEHCMLVIYFALINGNQNAIDAAICHDILKPKTFAVNKIGQPCFYGHEKVTLDNIKEFGITNQYIVDLVRCHMAPYLDAEWKSSKLVSTFVDIYGNNFIDDVEMLHNCDKLGTIRPNNKIYSDAEIERMTKIAEEYLIYREEEKR